MSVPLRRRPKKQKRRLASHVPEDNSIRRYVRWGRWKCVFRDDGQTMLFDIHLPFGISEQNDVATEHPRVIAAITDYLKANEVSAR